LQKTSKQEKDLRIGETEESAIEEAGLANCPLQIEQAFILVEPLFSMDKE